ncbi:MAG: 7,8-didemethyl-8-hydroxy-5-deazariboflavin synthase subunit CofH [Betaproteobacteria bacterium]|nr:7,8-didemethyl-8-hydroxy-5-deazariboflavin synthase subunit CofH [Betaproteobacteria bacterium]
MLTLSDLDLSLLAREWPLERLKAEAVRLRDLGHGDRVSYSRKVFIPLTRLCRDVCHYCTFSATRRQVPAPYLSPGQVLDIARAGARAGCHEALFTLGDQPEERWPEARAALDALGYRSTIDYLAAMADLVLRETGLLPHANPGVMTRDQLAQLRKVCASQGLMLETSAERLSQKGGPHHGSPDKWPQTRLATLRAAGELAIPFTTGILIGIGETRDERLDSLLALRDLHRQHGHIQEIIIQNFRAKPRTLMAGADEPDCKELAWTIALARIVFGPQMNIQAPPNLSAREYPQLIDAGINDWGGISPVTPDHVNPEAPWPAIEALRARTAQAGKILVERLPSYPSYALDARRWHDPRIATEVVRRIDAQGYARGTQWVAGQPSTPPAEPAPPRRSPTRSIDALLARAQAGDRLDESMIVRLFEARADDFAAVCAAADQLRANASGDTVRYVVNRNINYTNVCQHACSFCAFSKGRQNADLRGSPYNLDDTELARRAVEAWDRGATELCMQGGIHPAYTGHTYLHTLETVRQAAPSIHVHAFSPLEVHHGAQTLGLSIEAYLSRLQRAGLGSLPGTAAEILDDNARAILCPDKLNTAQWLAIMETAHRVGLPSTATIMFGHVDQPSQWAVHLLQIRDLQARTGGFTEFVPLPFIHMEAPLYRKGLARSGPTWREALLMHAVARLVLHPLIPNIQASWVKLGPEGVKAALAAGANDLGGTLTNESISRAAGTVHGQEFAPAQMDALIQSLNRSPQQRTTLYQPPPENQRLRSYRAAPAAPVVLTPIKRRAASAEKSLV